MILRLTQEQIDAINAAPPDETLEMIDEQAQQSFILFDKAAYQVWIWSQVQAGLNDNTHERWDVESIKREGRKKLEASRSAKP